jgi:hypothetical protein
MLMTIGFLSVAQADIIAYTSFEEVGLAKNEEGYDAQYIDTGDASVDHALVNNTGQMQVEYNTIIGGTEMGFSSSYVNTRDDVGLTDGDYVGVTDYTGVSYTNGTQGFEMSDPDGMMVLTLDTVNLTGYTNTGISLDLYTNSSGWESDDLIMAYVEMNDGAQIDLLNTTGYDIDNLTIEGVWTNLYADLSGYTSATLSIALDSNAATESIFIDNVVFEGSPVPVPAAIWLLGSGVLGLIGIGREKSRH